jgi:hypothetical protein
VSTAADADPLARGNRSKQPHNIGKGRVHLGNHDEVDSLWLELSRNDGRNGWAIGECGGMPLVLGKRDLVAFHIADNVGAADNPVCVTTQFTANMLR